MHCGSFVAPSTLTRFPRLFWNVLSCFSSELVPPVRSATRTARFWLPVQIIRINGLGSVFNELELLSRTPATLRRVAYAWMQRCHRTWPRNVAWSCFLGSHFQQILRSRRTIPPKPVNSRTHRTLAQRSGWPVSGFSDLSCVCAWKYRDDATWAHSYIRCGAHVRAGPPAEPTSALLGTAAPLPCLPLDIFVQL